MKFLTINRLAIRFALRRPTNGPIPRSGDKADRVDCFRIIANPKSETDAFLVREITVDGIKGYALEGDEFSKQSEMLNDRLAEAEIQIEHFAGPYDILYKSPIEFLFKESTGLYKLPIFRDKFEQTLFNRRNLSRNGRIEVLRAFIDETIARADDPEPFKVSEFGLMNHLYSHRWVRHPNSGEAIEYCKLILQSLSESGDLEHQDGRYTVAPSALTSLAMYEEDDRRHSDFVTHQKRIRGLTWALVLVGIGQIIVAYLAYIRG